LRWAPRGAGTSARGQVAWPCTARASAPLPRAPRRAAQPDHAGFTHADIGARVTTVVTVAESSCRDELIAKIKAAQARRGTRPLVWAHTSWAQCAQPGSWSAAASFDSRPTPNKLQEEYLKAQGVVDGDFSVTVTCDTASVSF
jgi:hypothetical protein